MATVQLPDYCEGTLAASKDGRWIATGSNDRSVVVWDAKTFESFFRHKENIQVRAVDFSPDSTRLVHASLASARQTYTATVWVVAAHKKVLTLDHEGWVIAAKYSPQGDRIATATHESVRVWDSNDGRLLMDIPVTVTQYYNARLLWSNNHLFFISDKRTLKQFEASTGSAVSEWPIDTTTFLLGSCIALPQHGAFIAYSIVTFWDTSTHAQLGLFKEPHYIRSIALSPDDRLLAIGGTGGKITIRSLSRITVSIVFLWIIADLNNFPVPLVFPNRIQSHCLVYSPLSKNLSFKSTTLRSIHGSTISSRTRRRY